MSSNRRIAEDEDFRAFKAHVRTVAEKFERVDKLEEKIKET